MTAEYEENYLVVSSTVTWPEFKLNLSVDTSEYYLMYIDMKVEAGTLASGEYLGFGYNNTFKDKIKTGEWFRFYIPVFALKTTFSEIKNCVRSTLEPYLYKKTHRNPIVIPVIINSRQTMEEIHQRRQAKRIRKKEE